MSPRAIRERLERLADASARQGRPWHLVDMSRRGITERIGVLAASSTLCLKLAQVGRNARRGGEPR